MSAACTFSLSVGQQKSASHRPHETDTIQYVCPYMGIPRYGLNIDYRDLHMDIKETRTEFICKCDSRRDNHTGYHETDTIFPYMGIPRYGLNIDDIRDLHIWAQKGQGRSG